MRRMLDELFEALLEWGLSVEAGKSSCWAAHFDIPGIWTSAGFFPGRPRAAGLSTLGLRIAWPPT
eukprot:1119169-Prorocentrum_lima.AAC.1